MKRTLAALTALLACLLIAACGGSSHCKAGDTSAGCVLAHLPQPVQKFALGPAKQGVDFAWSKVSPSQAGAFAASYVGHDFSKGWTGPLVASYHRARKGTVAVFEDAANRALAGFAAGEADARYAEGRLNALGYHHAHFDLAIDFDASGSQVLSYFQGANHAEPGLVGAYGGFFPLQYLCAHGVTHKSWQSYAWSRGLWLPASCAPLEQWLNGNTFDRDRAIARDYGQFPTPAKPKPLPVCVHHRLHRAVCAADKARLARSLRAEASSRKALANIRADLRQHGCRPRYKRPLCRSLGALEVKLEQRVRWFRANANRLQATV